MTTRRNSPPSDNSSQRNYKKFRLALVATTVFLIALLTGFTAWEGYRDYQNTIQTLEQQTASYARALKEHAERTFSELDHVLRTSTEDETMKIKALRLNQSHLKKLLQRNMGSLTRHASISVADASGRIQATTLDTVSPLPKIDDRSYFRYHRDNPSDRIVITPPFIAKISGKWRFALSRRISDHSGAFNGIVVATVDLSYFEQLYSFLATDQDSRFTLATVAGNYLVLVPATEEVYRSGKQTAEAFRKRLAQSPTGTYHTTRSNVAKQYRIVSYHRLENYPVVAIMSYGRDQALSAWRSNTIKQALTITVLSSIIVFLVTMVLRQFRLLEQRVQERTMQLQLANSFLDNEIKERNLAELQLQKQRQKIIEMGSALALAEEHERGILAAELHDQVGQRLILTKIKLAQLSDETTDQTVYQSIMEVDRLVEQSLHDIRSLTLQLRPPILANAGLLPAIQWLGQELQRDYGLEIRFDVFEQGSASQRLKYEIRSTLFQMVRELLINIAKHAGVNLAWISLQLCDDLFLIRLSDNGRGFSGILPLPGHTGGFGLFNLKNRLEYLGGSLEIDTAPGKGTCTTITLEIRPDMLEKSDRSETEASDNKTAAQAAPHI